LNLLAIFPICEAVQRTSARDGVVPLYRSGAGRAIRFDMSQPLGTEGLARMSRITLLQGIWLAGSGPGKGLLRFVKSPEAGYPPYNIEALAEGDGATAVRITLAVAGFRVDELAVTAEDGQLVIRGQQGEERVPNYIYRGIAARRFKRSFGLADGVEVRKAELHNGLLAIEIERQVKEATVKTVQIINGEAARRLERAAVSDAE
jgi:HSP20 family molecular chaperone IbpA